MTYFQCEINCVYPHFIRPNATIPLHILEVPALKRDPRLGYCHRLSWVFSVPGFLGECLIIYHYRFFPYPLKLSICYQTYLPTLRKPLSSKRVGTSTAIKHFALCDVFLSLINCLTKKIVTVISVVSVSYVAQYSLESVKTEVKANTRNKYGICNRLLSDRIP
jgi:hypothetical protein